MRLSYVWLTAIPASGEINWRSVYSHVKHARGDVEDLPHWQMTWWEMKRIIESGVYDGVEPVGQVKCEPDNIYSPLAHTPSSVIYTGELKRDDSSAQSLIFKYVHNCMAIANNVARTWWGGYVNANRADEDDLVHEYILIKALTVPMSFGHALTWHALVPQLFGLSKRIPLLEFEFPRYANAPERFAFPFDGLNNRDCRESGRGAVRYLVEERVGLSMGEYWDTIQKAARSPSEHLAVLRAILHMGVQLMQMLKELHGRGVLHNDIKANNIAFVDATKSATELDPSVDRLVFIDFGLSEFYPRSLTSPKKWFPTTDMNLFTLSPWNLQGSPRGRRDDVYRAVAILGMMVSRYELGKSYEGDFDARAWKGDVASLAPLIKRKLNPNMFCVSELAKIVDLKRAKQVVDILNSIVEKIVVIPRFDSRPDYNLYIAKLRHALHVLS